MNATVRVLTGELHRVQRGHGKCFVHQPPLGSMRRPARVALMLALAHKIQHAIREGLIRDRADVARRLGFTRARLTHLLDLTLLSPDIQEQVLFLEAIDGVQPISERALRAIARTPNWATQRQVWGSSLGATESHGSNTSAVMARPL